MGNQIQGTSLNDSLMNLPLMKNFSESQIVSKVDTFRKGEKNIFWFLKLAVFGAIGFAAWKYILPPVFMALGRGLAVIGTGILLVALVMLAPVIFKGLRMFSRYLQKKLIGYDPFGQLAIERQKMIANQTTFRIAKANIAMLTNDMEVEAKRAENDVAEGEKTITRLKAKAEGLRKELTDMVAEGGVAAKGEDPYVNKTAELQKVLAESVRVANRLKQSAEFKQKYGARGNIMKKMGQKLVLVETVMEIKIADFDATVEFLHKDYEFAQKSNAATTAAKGAMGFSKGWEFDYALETITATIAADTAMTSGNLRDIESLTSNYDLNSDELFDNLSALADKIEVGDDKGTTAKQFANPEYQLSTGEKQASGFGGMF